MRRPRGRPPGSGDTAPPALRSAIRSKPIAETAVAQRFSRDLASVHPNPRGTRRLSRSKPMETTRNPGPFRLSGITPAAGFMVGDGLTGNVGVLGTIEVQ